MLPQPTLKKNHSSNNTKSSPPNLSEWAAEAMLPLLKSAHISDDDWISTVSVLLNTVHASSILSLKKETPIYVQTVIDTMLHDNNVVRKESNNESKSNGSEGNGTNETRVVGQRRAQLAMSTAVAVTLRHGTLSSILSLCRKLLRKFFSSIKVDWWMNDLLRRLFKFFIFIEMIFFSCLFSCKPITLFPTKTP